jgi:hypothetical protein
LVGFGKGVSVGNALGKGRSVAFRPERFIGLEGIKTHKTIAKTTKINPIGTPIFLELRGWFRREKMRRLDIGLLPPAAVRCNFTSD